ncbi:hypothetical protein [Pantoea sp.]|uniref:hypothetical protein n=1 Tax=Pantoea sp. TaxID=69393 RepID=UPI00290C51D1|nr:hypothetical protein [Pantoea sp.]MDU5472262.1 hypothetical protein [Pantoea sp.]
MISNERLDEIAFGDDWYSPEVKEAMVELLAHRNTKPAAWIAAGEYAILRRLKQHSAVEVGLFNAQRFSDDTPLFTSPHVPAGWKIVPVEPTEKMVTAGFESAPDESFSPQAEWEKYQAMSGCEQAAHRAKLCYAAMLAAAPSPPDNL